MKPYLTEAGRDCATRGGVPNVYSRGRKELGEENATSCSAASPISLLFLPAHSAFPLVLGSLNLFICLVYGFGGTP